jgi:outer membrane protein assembly factor BamB
MRLHSIICLGLVAAASGVCAEDWLQWLGTHRDSEWRETGLLEKFPDGGPKVVWRTPINVGYSGPAVADGKVYVFDYLVKDGGDALDQNKRGAIHGDERVLCLDEATGKPLWEYKYPCEYTIAYPGGPRATPTVIGGKVYALGAEGTLSCLDADKGGVFWKKDLREDYKTKTPMWGFACHPLVEGNKLFCIVGGEGSVVVAFDKDSGKELWKALSAREPGYSSPVITEAGGKRQLLIWNAESLNGLDPETGALYWTVPIAPANGMSIMMPVRSGDVVYVGARVNQGVAVKLAADKPEAKALWRADSKTGLFAKTCSPVVDGAYMYGVCENGELRCVKVETGERMWETYAPVAGVKAGSAAAYIVKNGSRFIIFSEKGDLIFANLSPKGYEEISRAHIIEPTSTVNGRQVLWSHPAFADKKCFVRNGKEIICVSLAAEK